MLNFFYYCYFGALDFKMAIGEAMDLCVLAHSFKCKSIVKLSKFFITYRGRTFNSLRIYQWWKIHFPNDPYLVPLRQFILDSWRFSIHKGCFKDSALKPNILDIYKLLVEIMERMGGNKETAVLPKDQHLSTILERAMELDQCREELIRTRIDACLPFSVVKTILLRPEFRMMKLPPEQLTQLRTHFQEQDAFNLGNFADWFILEHQGNPVKLNDEG